MSERQTTVQLRQKAVGDMPKRKAERKKLPDRGPRELMAEISAMLGETAALLLESMELTDEMRKRLRAAGIEPPAQYAGLLARYAEFVRSTDV